jgi:hypothetical protein
VAKVGQSWDGAAAIYFLPCGIPYTMPAVDVPARAWYSRGEKGMPAASIGGHFEWPG